MNPTQFFIVALGAVIIIAGAIRLRRAFERVTIHEFERGLRYDRGRFVAVAEPGLYTIWRPTTSIARIDIRPRVISVSGQEVLSADGVALKVSVAARYRVSDPTLAVHGVADFELALHMALQLALRAVVAANPVEQLLEARATLGREITTRAAEAVRPLGLELEDADIKDLTLPGELKKIFTQVVRARQEGLAALEKARGETAALRNLANAAQMIERNPHLMQLRLLQVIGQQSGNTVVLGVPPASGPIPVRPAGSVEPPQLGGGDESS